jgi:hypothetical protein
MKKKEKGIRHLDMKEMISHGIKEAFSTTVLSFGKGLQQEIKSGGTSCLNIPHSLLSLQNCNPFQYSTFI